MKTTTDPVISREMIVNERLDAIRQRDEAQQKATEAQTMMQRAQQLQQEAAQAALVANGAIQQNDAFLKMLDKLAKNGSPALPSESPKTNSADAS